MRKICVMLLAAVISFGVVGCGDKPAAPAAPTAPTTPAKPDEKKPDAAAPAPAPKADEKK